MVTIAPCEECNVWSEFDELVVLENRQLCKECVSKSKC